MVNFIKQLCTKKILSQDGLKLVLPLIYSNKRSYSSALFVPGNRANQTFSYISLDLDFSECLADTQRLQKDLNQRNVKADVHELKKAWNYYQTILSDREVLEEKRLECRRQMKKLFTLENPSPDDLKEKENLTQQNELFKEDLRVIKNTVWELEESIIPQILKLPNEVDERTPIQSPHILKNVGEKPSVANNKRQSHLDIGKNLGLLDYHNPLQCYLCDEAAFFELEALAFVGEILAKNNFIRVALPDFCRSLVVEGSGMDHESAAESFILQEETDVKEEFLVNRLHLLGGASLPPLLAMHTKKAFKTTDFPVKVFSTGRQYTPFPNTSTAHGLFSVCQASAVHASTLVEKKNSKEYENEFQNLIETTTKIYDNIGHHYRIVVRPARELSFAESMRVSFEMWSVHANQYIEVGHVSACGDYFSKRLMIACLDKEVFNYPAAVTGTLLSVPKVLGCLIEENPDEFTIPDKLKGFFD